ncbi:MAG TPA: Ig domain-containing protein, partial [Gaiella sp.]|nr:Ig domain-containing protein [Gaiella sp.]
MCIAGVILIPGAGAGNFDEGRMGCPGENPGTCPTGAVGKPYSLTIYLSTDKPAEERGEDFPCATFRVSSGAFPPGLSISDEGIIGGTPTQAGTYDFFLTVQYDRESSCPAKSPSDDRFVISINPGSLAAPAAPTVAVTTASLPDGNINQAYTSPGLTASGATVTSWALAGGTLPAG